jgi:DNA-binding PadR family transcriptional regulator
MDMPENQVVDGLKLELRRGSLVLGVLAALRVEQYGYTLRNTLAAHGIEIEEGPLYPMLRRLEDQGLLQSEWREEGKRNKRFYALSPAGEKAVRLLENEWRQMNGSLEQLLKEKQHEPA